MVSVPESKYIEALEEENKVLVRANKKVYPREVLLEVAQKFVDTCWIEVEEKEEHFLIQIKPKKEYNENLEVLGRNFMDHALAKIQGD